MSDFSNLRVLLAAVLVIAATLPPVEARTRKGDKMLAQGRIREQRQDWDAALEYYEQALSQDPGDIAYQLSARRARMQSAAHHVEMGLKARNKGLLTDAMVEFQKAYAIDPASMAAEEEIRRTRQMIEREEKKSKESGAKPSTPEERALTPAQAAKKQMEEKLSTALPVPELRPLNPQPINVKMNNQPPRVLFETVGKLAGINVLFDPDYQPGKNQSIEFNGSTLDETLDYLAVVTKSFWKPLSANTIFITNDNTTKRRDYEEQVMKVFYLNNVNTPQELQEIVTVIRSVADIQRLFVYNAQNAIIARGEADRIALAEKIINDLDKPRSEVVVDVLVMEVASAISRKLAAAITPTGLNIPITFNPRQSIRAGISNTSSGTGTDLGTGTAAATTSTAIPLSNIGKLSTSDYAVVLPDALLQALLTDSGTKVLQSPQLRSVDNQKASLKIGDRQPVASGSFQPGIGGVGINPLVNTQFNFIDTGVNVDMVPRVHDNGEVSIHIEMDISKVTSHVNLGGIDQPVIGQRKVVHDVRMKEGEINVLGGLMQEQDSKTVSGVPGLARIPLLGRLFSSEDVEKSESELVIVLVPHILRRPEINYENLRGIAVGNATTVKLNYAPQPGAAAPPAPGPRPAPAAAGAKPAAPPSPGTPAAPLVTTPSSSTPPATTPPPAAPNPPTAPPPAAAAKPQAAAPQGAVTVAFVPSQLSITPGGLITATVVVRNAADLFAAPMQIKFDPKILRMNSIVRGDLMSGDGQQVIFTMNILNDAGTATVNLSRMPSTPGVTGSGTLVTITFQAVNRGTANVSIPQLTLRNSQGQTISSSSPLLIVNVR